MNDKLISGNKLFLLLYIAIPVLLIIPFNKIILDVMLVIASTGILLISCYSIIFKRIKISFLYIIFAVVLFKSFTVYSLFKNTVLHPADSSDLINLILDFLSFKGNPVDSFYQTAVLIFFYYLMMKYNIMRKSNLISGFIPNAIPGMQMTIDCKFANGEISIEEAESQRRVLKQKVDMFNVYNEIARLLFWENVVIWSVYIISISAVVFREFYSTGVIFSSTASGSVIILNSLMIFSILGNMVLSLTCVKSDLKVFNVLD